MQSYLYYLVFDTVVRCIIISIILHTVGSVAPRYHATSKPFFLQFLYTFSIGVRFVPSVFMCINFSLVHSPFNLYVGSKSVADTVLRCLPTLVFPESFSLLGESSELHMHSLKVLKVIKCVGETLKQREAGSTMEVVAEQTKTIAGKTYKRSGYEPRRWQFAPSRHFV